MSYSIYYILSDTDVMFMGTKKECIDYYKNLPNPYPMKLLKVIDQWILKKYGRFIQCEKTIQ